MSKMMVFVRVHIPMNLLTAMKQQSFWMESNLILSKKFQYHPSRPKKEDK